MAINRILHSDVFGTDRLNPGENRSGIHIITATNNLGRNKDGQSVAYQIGAKFEPDFLQFPEGVKNLGDVYTRKGEIDGVQARFSALVANQIREGSNPRDTDHDWDFASGSIAQGLATLSADATIRIPESRKVEQEIGILKYIREQPGSLDDIKYVLAQHDASVNPVIRSVFMGTGRSGSLNQADTTAILQAMVDSDLNIYLYLKSLEVRAHVAEVIRLNPYLHRHQPLDEYAELQLAA